MSTFNLIVKKIIKPENNIFSSNYDKTDNITLLNKVFFQKLLNQSINAVNKFHFLNNTLHDVFLKNNNKKEEFIELFCKIQKTYKVLNRFAFMYKYKNTKIVVNTDMGLNEINENQKNVFCIFDKNAKYLFTVNDIINIINTALTNNYNFFSEPICVKNPYNNLPFTKSNLYNIYLFIKYNTHLRPELFFHFFDCNFNLSVFKKKYEDKLREASIIHYVYKTDTNTLVDEIQYMIRTFNNNCRLMHLKNNIFIDSEFPKDKLLKIMRPYLLLFFMSRFSLLTYKKEESQTYLKELLLKFNNFNPQFGKKKIKIKVKYNKRFEKIIVGKIIEFDENHISFKNIQKEKTDFLEDHLKYSEKMYYVNNELITLDNYESEQYYDEDDDSNNDINNGNDGNDNSSNDSNTYDNIIENNNLNNNNDNVFGNSDESDNDEENINYETQNEINSNYTEITIFENYEDETDSIS